MAVVQLVRKHKLTPTRCLPTQNPLHIEPKPKTAPDVVDAVSVAIDHVGHLRRMGIGITQAMAAINLTADRGEGWDAVMWAYAQAFERVRTS